MVLNNKKKETTFRPTYSSMWKLCKYVFKC